MAIFRASAVVGSISGTLGSTTFVHTGASKVIRRRPNSTDRQSPKQLAQRVRLRVVQNLWPTLTPNQRQAWVTHALIFTASNRLGVQRPISGWQYFLKINLLQLSAELPPVLQPPLGFVTQPLYSAGWFALAPNTLITNSALAPGVPADNLQIWAQRSFSDFPQGSWNNLVLLGNYSGGLGLNNVTVQFHALLGVPDTNEWIATRLHPHIPPNPPGPGLINPGRVT